MATNNSGMNDPLVAMLVLQARDNVRGEEYGTGVAFRDHQAEVYKELVRLTVESCINICAHLEVSRPYDEIAQMAADEIKSQFGV